MSENIQITSFADLEQEQQMVAAEWVHEFTSGQLGETQQMIPVSVEDVFAKHIGYVLLADGKPAGFIGAIAPNQWNGQEMTEIGTHCVDKSMRGQGLGSALLKAIMSEIEDQGLTGYAFCNAKSIGVFSTGGFVEATSFDVPPCALDDCSKCPAQPENGCCDTILIEKER